jgi:opacity protein-like surface antigen
MADDNTRQGGHHQRPLHDLQHGRAGGGEIEAALGINATTTVAPPVIFAEGEAAKLGQLPIDAEDYLLFDKDDQIAWGFALGGGVAAQIVSGFVIDLSYLYVNLPGRDFDFDFGPIATGDADIGFDAHLGRAALSYHF